MHRSVVPGTALAIAFTSVPLATTAQTFLRCEGVSAAGSAHATPFDRTYAFDDSRIYAPGLGNRLADLCVVGSYARPDAEFGPEHAIDDVRCTVDAEVLRVETTTPATRSLSASGRGEPWYTEFEIYRSNGDIRTMVGHSFEGAGICERIEDPRSTSPAF